MAVNPDKLFLTALLNLGRITREDWGALPAGQRPASALLTSGKITATHLQEAIGFVATRMAVCPSCGKDYVFPQAPSPGSAFACTGCKKPFTAPQANLRLTENDLGIGAMAPPTASAPSSASLEPVARWLPFGSGAYLMLLALLPVLMIDCGPLQFTWNGVQLFQGSEPSIAGGGDLKREMEKQGMTSNSMGMSEGEKLRDPIFIAVPILGLAIVVCWACNMRQATAVLAALAVLVFAFYSIFGFRLERAIKSKIKEAEAGIQPSTPQEKMGQEVGMSVLANMFKPTNWFWLGLVAASLAAVSAAWLDRHERRSRAPP